jgi:hypothetical protein
LTNDQYPCTLQTAKVQTKSELYNVHREVCSYFLVPAIFSSSIERTTCPVAPSTPEVHAHSSLKEIA